jgi:hypothetical protein
MSDTKKYINREIKMFRREIKYWRRLDRRAIDKAHNNMEKRLDGMNEFRSQLKDQAGTFVTRKDLWLAAIAIVGVVLAIMQLIFKLK